MTAGSEALGAPVARVAMTATAWRTVGLMLAAFCYSFAVPPFGWPSLAWIVPGLLLVSIRGVRPRNAFLCGVAFSMLIGYGITGWAIDATLVYFGFNRALSAAFAAVVWLLYGGIPYGLLLAAYTAAAPRLPYAARAPLGAMLWAGSELVRATLLTGMPWELLGHTQFAYLPMIQIADLGGVYAVSFVIALASLTVAELVAQRFETGQRPPLRRLAAPALLVAATLAYGVWQQALHATPVAKGDAGAHHIAVVQSSVPNEFRWKRAFFERTLAIHAQLTATARRDRPELVVWPENAVNFYIEREPMLRAQLEGLARTVPQGLLVGGPRLDGGERAFNSAYLFDGSGTLAGIYDKRHLVPFAEYDPLPWYGGEDIDGPATFTAGVSAGPLRSGGLKMGTVICYEVLFPDLVRALVAEGAEILINLSNDSWLDAGTGVAPEQHLSMSVFRAVETRRYLVRAASSGVSGFVSPYGEIYARIERNERGVVSAPVAASTAITPYVIFGDAWVYLGNLLIGLWAVARYGGAVRDRRKR